MKLKNYRLSEETRYQINWLKERLGVSATDIIRLAVAGLFDEERAKLPLAQLVETPEGWVLASQGNAVLGVGSGAVEDLPEEVRSRLLAGTADVGEAFSYLLLTAARVGENVSWNRSTVVETLVRGQRE
jgi:hypothetical protein